MSVEDDRAQAPIRGCWDRKDTHCTFLGGLAQGRMGRDMVSLRMGREYVQVLV